LSAGRAVAKAAASTSQTGRFETVFLATDENVAALADLSGQWIDRVHARYPSKAIVLDMDSSVSPTHGDQEGLPTAATSPALATIRCSCSTRSAIWNGALYGPAPLPP
jgi:hypothetical protein